MLSFFMKAALTPMARAVSVFVKDPHWDKVVLQMNFDGTVGSRYFVDDVGHQVLLRGNPTVGTPARFGTGALVQTDGNSGLEVIGGSEFALGGDFTVEIFAYFSSFGLKQFCGQWGNYRTWQIYTDQNGYVYFQSATTAYFGASGGAIGPANAYYHVAVTRQAGVMRLFINGVLRATLNDSTAFPYRTDGRFGVGKVFDQDGYGFVNGALDSIRITNGLARYTQAFTPPKLPFVSNRAGVEWDYTVALLKGEGPDGGLVIHDSMNYGDFTAFDGAKISTERKKFGSSSMKFLSATNSSIQSPSRPGYSFGRGDFTIECQVSFLSLAGPGGIHYNTIVSGLSASTDGGGAKRWSVLVLPNGALLFDNDPIDAANAFTETTQAGILTVGEHFHHIVVARSNGVMYYFVDGVRYTPVTRIGVLASNAVIDSYGPLRLGRFLYSAQYNWSMDGYIDELRIVKGMALYTENFTPPTREFVLPTGDVRWNHVAFLSHFEGANGTKVVVDEKNKTAALVGNTAISTLQKRFGESSLYFPGELGSYMSIPESPDTTFYSDDFTIEMQVYFDGVQPSALPRLFDRGLTGNMAIAMEANRMGFFNGSWIVKSNTDFPFNQWVHLALCRVGNNYYLFQNGILVSTGSSGMSYGVNGRPTYIGSGNNATANQFFKGWIDELRITRGYGRYTKNFIPPAIAFPSSL